MEEQHHGWKHLLTQMSLVAPSLGWNSTFFVFLFLHFLVTLVTILTCSVFVAQDGEEQPQGWEHILKANAVDVLLALDKAVSLF